MIELANIEGIYLYAGKTDMRYGLDKLVQKFLGVCDK